jgi:hypothetical protein
MKFAILPLILTLFVLTSLSNDAVCQDKIQQDLVWARTFFHLPINEKWTLHQELEQRFFIAPSRHHQFLFRTRGTYKINPELTAGAGISYFHAASPSLQDQPISILVHEVRPQLEFATATRFNSGVRLVNRFWMELRFTNTGQDPLQYRFSRFRYMLQLDYRLPNKPWTFGLIDEVLLFVWNNVNDQVFDHNRLGGFVTHHFTDDLELQFEYIWWYQVVGNNELFFDRNIYRLTLGYTI